MALEVFLKVDGVDGESEDRVHAGEIQLISFSFGADQPGYASVGGGLGAGKVDVHNLVVVKYVDKSSPKLFVACCTGQHTPTATLTVRKANAGDQDCIALVLTDVIVSSHQVMGAVENVMPTEQVSFNFVKIEFQYQQIKADGTASGTIKSGYDLKRNMKI
jgi:type VI secretion system secreted protein Hcp